MGSARPTAQGSLIAPPERGRLFQAAATAAGLAAFAVAYFWPLLRSTEPRSFGSDFAAQTYPSHRYVSAVLSEGRLPHWAPEIGFGFPLLADIASGRSATRSRARTFRPRSGWWAPARRSSGRRQR